jgi:hypothetical protein
MNLRVYKRKCRFSLVSQSKTCQTATTRLSPRPVSLGLAAIPVFLKLGSVNSVRGSERRKWVMAEVFHWRPSICMYELKFVWRHSTLIIPSLMARIQSIASSVQKLPDIAVKSGSTARHTEGRCVRRNDQVIDQNEVSR